MKLTMNRIALIGIVVLAVALSYSRAFAQQDSVKISLDFQMYDVVYVTDFVDIKNQQLNANIPGISLSLQPNRNLVNFPTKFWVCIYVEMHVQLRGEADQELMHAYTNNFDMIKHPQLAARDFAQGGSSEIYIRDGSNTYVENATLRKTLENMVSNNAVAPPGKYTIMMKVLRATSENPGDRGVPNTATLGSSTKTVTVQFSATADAFVEITDPKNGSFFSNLAPTFSWTSNSDSVRVSVYEALASNRSPQDALNGGNPNLVRQSYGYPPDFSGTSLTYPSNAERKLEQNKAYVLLVEVKVSSNRGDQMRRGLPVVFRITDDKVGQMLDNFLNAFSGSASATYSTLRADPNNWVAWSQYGNITLDGSTLTETDLQSLINDLASRPDLKIQLGVENQ